MDTRESYLSQLPADRQAAMRKLFEVLQENLPAGFEFAMSYGMPAFVVPHTIYPKGYHVDPKQPLPFVSVASQKAHIALYHFGLYADPDLLNWFTASYAERVKTKLNMGKSCIRFAKPEQIPFELIGELMTKMDVPTWIATYEESIKKS
jgi:uncharacterized protein YdhG (YjbR/CyaY superfamily)